MALKEGIVKEQLLVDKKKVKQKIWHYSWDLMAVDDLSKCIVLDPYIGFTSHKTDKNSFLEDDVSSKIEEKFKQYSPVNLKNISKLQTELTDLVQSNKLLYKFNVQYLSWLQLMVKSYLKVLSQDSPVSIEECNRYQGDNFKGVKVSAKTMITKNTILHILIGYHKTVDKTTCEFLESQKLDFSIMKSNMKKLDVIMLGPAALLNHDCIPNCEYLSSTKESIKINTISDIQAGEELLCYYGDNFFGPNNEECACKSCENNHIGYYKQKNRILVTEYLQSQSFFDKGTETNIVLAQADSLQILGVNSNPVSHELIITKNIYSLNIMQLVALQQFYNEYLKYNKMLHRTDTLNSKIDIISIDICSLIRKINDYKNILMLEPTAFSNHDYQANRMIKPQLLDLASVDCGACTEDNDGFLGFSKYTKLENKLDECFVVLNMIDTICDWQKNEKKHVCTETEEKHLPLTRPKIGYLFCIYCDRFKTQLPRHLMLKHSDKKFVQNFLINCSAELDKNAALTFIRNQGFGHYYELTGKTIPVYSTRKDSRKDVRKVQCSNCFAHFSHETFQKHLKNCNKVVISEMKNKGLL